MKTVTKTATQARQEFFDLINAAKYGGQVTTITKNGHAVAQLNPIEKQPSKFSSKSFDWAKYRKVLEETRGIFTDEDIKDMKEARDSFNEHFSKSDW